MKILSFVVLPFEDVQHTVVDNFEFAKENVFPKLRKVSRKFLKFLNPFLAS